MVGRYKACRDKNSNVQSGGPYNRPEVFRYIRTMPLYKNQSSRQQRLVIEGGGTTRIQVVGRWYKLGRTIVEGRLPNPYGS